VEAVEGEGAANLRRERAEEVIPRRTEAQRRKGGAAAMGRASGTGAAFYRQMGREEGGESKPYFYCELLRGGGATRGLR
jgi:hypothetical protein